MLLTRRLSPLVLFVAFALQGSTIDIPVDYGPHAVGFRTLFQYDYSRTYRRFDAAGAPVANPARPIETLIWYPAEAGSGTTVHYGDYVELAANEESLEQATAEQKKAAVDRFRFAMSDADWTALEEMPVHAARGAKAARGRFPLVVYAPGAGGNAFSNSALCEMLASHGYVVAASPSLGPHAHVMSLDAAGAEGEARDMLFIMASLRDDPQVDPSQVALVGQSWGGLANIFAAIENPTVGAVVCLDGSIRYVYDVFASWHDGVVGKLSTPVLFIAHRPFTPEELAQAGNQPKRNFFDDVKSADFWYVTMSRMRHIDFRSNTLRVGPADPKFTLAEMAEAYAWNARYVRKFLDAMLKGDASARAFLNADPSTNGAPAGLVTVNAHKASTLPSGVEEFAHYAATTRGIANASAVFAELRKSNAGYSLDESEMNGWGYDLLRQKKFEDAIAVFRLNTELYPKSANTYDSLGEVYAAAGRKDDAIQNYKKSLELNPGNTNASDWLKKLGAG